MESVEIIMSGNERRSAECYRKIGNMAVTRLSEGHSWRVTHLPTGCALPYTFGRAIDAEAVLCILDRETDWDGLVGALSKGEKPRKRERIQEVCISFGKYSDGRKVSLGELSGRLSA